MRYVWKRLGLLAVLGGVLVLANGCAYLNDRGSDAMDIMDMGFTFSSKPQVGAYVGFQSFLGVGYANVHGKMFGMAGHKSGLLDMDFKAGGMVLQGEEEWAYDGDGLKRHGVGLGLIDGDRPERTMEYFNCPKFVHLGFFGVNLTCHLGELADFLIGWTTLDIGNDDKHHRAQAALSEP